MAKGVPPFWYPRPAPLTGCGTAQRLFEKNLEFRDHLVLNKTVDGVESRKLDLKRLFPHAGWFAENDGCLRYLPLDVELVGKRNTDFETEL